MSERPTPETDIRAVLIDRGEGQSVWMIDQAFACHLERQRDSALAELAQLKEDVKPLVEALKAIHSTLTSLIGESAGVYGYHLNGDTTPWPDLLSGGKFEYLPDLDSTESIISTFTQHHKL